MKFNEYIYERFNLEDLKFKLEVFINNLIEV